MALPKLSDVLFFGAELSTARIIGLVLVPCAFVLLNGKGSAVRRTAKKGYFVCQVALCVSVGVFLALINAHRRVAPHAQDEEMMAVASLVSAVAAFIYRLVVCRGSKARVLEMALPARTILCGGVALFGMCAWYMLFFLQSHVSASTLDAALTGLLWALSMLLGKFIIHNDLRAVDWAGAAVALCSLILMSF